MFQKYVSLLEIDKGLFMKTIHMCTKSIVMCGCVSIVLFFFGIFVFVRKNSTLSTDIVIEQNDLPVFELPMSSFMSDPNLQWKPGRVLPLDVNQALLIVEEWVAKQSVFSSYSSCAEELALKHLKDDYWYYQYDAWLIPSRGGISTHITILLNMAGNIIYSNTPQ